jgi:hypothetical protein
MGRILSIHEDLTRDPEIQTSSDRSFGFVFTVVFIVISLLPWFGGVGEIYLWAIFVSAFFLAISIVKPVLLSPLNKIWTKFGLLLQKIISPVVLGTMFYLVIAPFGLVMRMMGKDMLRLKLDKEATSYWIDRTPPGPSPDSMKNQY